MSAGLAQQGVEARVLNVVQEVLGLEDEPRDLDLSIAKELAVDSLDQLSLFMALEDEFGGYIREEDIARISTLRDVVEHVRKCMNVAPSE